MPRLLFGLYAPRVLRRLLGIQQIGQQIKQLCIALHKWALYCLNQRGIIRLAFLFGVRLQPLCHFPGRNVLGFTEGDQFSQQRILLHHRLCGCIRRSLYVPLLFGLFTAHGYTHQSQG